MREPGKSILRSLDFTPLEVEEVEEEGGEGKDMVHQMKTRPKVLRGTWQSRDQRQLKVSEMIPPREGPMARPTWLMA